MIPVELRGAWRRRSIKLGDAPAHETARVVWLQAAVDFADLRVPRGTGRPVSFAGEARWEAPHLRWSHVLDLDRPGTSPITAGAEGDRGEISWDGEDMVERGFLEVDGKSTPYVEVWQRLTAPDAPTGSWTSSDETGRMVWAAEHALTVVDSRSRGGDYRAAYRQLRRGGWTTVFSLGPGAEDLPTPHIG